MLKQAGVGLKDLAAHEFLNKHENVALGVLSGDFDAGAVKEETFQHYEQRGLKLLATTPPISEHVMTAGGRVPEKTAAALQRALFRLKDTVEGRALLNGVKEHTTGFTPAADADYGGLRRILRELDAMGVH
jgi:phosphonate transport system substrate-binding protein